jgi:hypothetical protein
VLDHKDCGSDRKKPHEIMGLIGKKRPDCVSARKNHVLDRKGGKPQAVPDRM